MPPRIEARVTRSPTHSRAPGAIAFGHSAFSVSSGIGLSVPSSRVLAGCDAGDEIALQRDLGAAGAQLELGELDLAAVRQDAALGVPLTRAPPAAP